MPCCARPIFAASAAHSILLEPGADVEVQLAEAAGGDHQALLQLEVGVGEGGEQERYGKGGQEGGQVIK